MKIYPIKPYLRSDLWGGERLFAYGKSSEATKEAGRISESWELSFHKDGKTRIDGGKTLEETLTAKEIGTNCAPFPFFPVLSKFIDAKEDLSVQVHPSDEYALKEENSFGKTEMWYTTM